MLWLMFNGRWVFTPSMLDRLETVRETENLVHSAQSHERINQPGVRTGFTKDPSDQVVIKESDQAPVKASYEEYCCYYDVQPFHTIASLSVSEGCQASESHIILIPTLIILF
jgi:hypothetical protein